jgi:23S rRNA (adenine1618-N6)-methyltransferase
LQSTISQIIRGGNKSTIRKVSNLEAKKQLIPYQFLGHDAELWCEGGELGFITQMIFESAKYPLQCLWFTTLVSKQSHLSSIYKTLNKVNAATIKTIAMAQGQKTSRIVAWTFLSEKQQNDWKF